MEAEQEDGRQSSLGSHILPISKSKLELLEYAIQEHDHSTVAAILNSIDDINKYEILTRKQREDNSCNLLCMADDADTIALLLQSIPEDQRLTALTIKEYQHSQWPSTNLFVTSSRGLRSWTELRSPITFLYSILTTLNKKERGLLLRETSAWGVQPLLPMVISNTRTSQSSDFQIVSHALGQLLLSLDIEDLMHLLSINDSLHCKTPPILSYQIIHKIELFKIVMNCVPYDRWTTLLGIKGTEQSNSCLLSCLLSMLRYKQAYEERGHQSVEERKSYLGFVEDGDDSYHVKPEMLCNFSNTFLSSVHKNVSKDDYVMLLRMVDNRGSPALHSVRDMKVLRLIIDKVSHSEDCFDLLGMQDGTYGHTILVPILQQSRCYLGKHEEEQVEDFGVILNHVSHDNLEWLLSMGNGTLLNQILENEEMTQKLLSILPSDKMLAVLLSENCLSNITTSLQVILQSLKEQDRLKLMSKRDTNGNTILHLISKSADVDKISSLKLLPETERIRLLMAQNNAGGTPLHHTEILGTIKHLKEIMVPSEEIQLLLSIRDSEGETILHQSEPQVIIDILEMFKFPSPEEFIGLRDKRKQTVLHRLAGNTNTALVKILGYINEEKRFNLVHLKDIDKNSLLHMINYKTADTITSILKCFENSYEKRDLLKLPDRNGDTPIHHIITNYPHTLRHVISDLSPEINFEVLSSQNHDGISPMHIAALNPPPIIRLILDNVEQPHIPKLLSLRNKRGYTVVHIAAGAGNSHTVECMTNYVSTSQLLDILDIDIDKEELTTVTDTNNREEFYRRLQELKYEERCVLLDVLGSKAGVSLKRAVDDINSSEVQNLQEEISRSSLHQIQKDYERLQGFKFHNGGSVIHLLTHRRDSERLRKLLSALDPTQRQAILSLKDINNKTPLDVAFSYEVRQLLNWSSSQEGFYYLPTPPVVLIMYSTKDRQGAEEERMELSKVFPDFNVDVRERRDLRKRQMLDEIRMAQMKDDISALIIIIMSHGVHGAVCASDEDVRIQDILRHMCVPFLEGKPKVLMIQACQSPGQDNFSEIRAGVDPRPPSTQSTTTQSTVSRNQPTQETGNVERAGYTIEHRDVITMMSTVSGGVAYRQQMIPMFAEELRDSANNGDIYEIFLKTHEKLRNKLKGTAGEGQIPEYRSTLTKKLSLRNIFAHS